MDEKIYSEDITVAASQNIKERDYWLAKLSGELTRTYFPYDRKGPAPVGYASDRVIQKYPESLFSKLIQLSNGVDYSLHVILVAGVVLLLGKYTGSKDITVGTPIYRQEQEGEFINTVLALRNRLDRHMTFKQLLLQVKQNVVEATENQNYPFETLLYKLNRSTSNGGPPLFDVAVLLENIHDKQYIRHAIPNMLFCFKRTPQFIEGVVEYNPYLYEKASIRRIITHLFQLFQAALPGLDSPVTDIDLLSGEERKQILFDFNHTKKEFPRNKLFAGLFEKTVSSSPDRVAAIYKDRHVTYKQLHRQVDGITHLLLKKGVDPGKVAAVMMRRSVNMLASMLGIFKVGGVYLPVEVDLPGERIKYMLENSEARVLIADGEPLPIPLGNIPCLQVTVTESAFGMNPPGNLQHKINPGNLAYMIYTSGTTGKPKGVLIHHRGMINHLFAKINELSITREDIIAQTASASFDISIWQFLTALIKGGSTAIIDKEVFLDPPLLLAVLAKKKVTIMESVPSLMYQFFQLLAPDQDRELKRMRWMLFTGEPLKKDLVKTWFQNYPGIKIANAYGPTEASDDITHHLMAAPPPGDERIVPIGKPLQNLHVYILNRDLKLCPIGAIGEICVAGVGVGKGYWKDPDWTAQCFITNPYLDMIGDKDYSLLYKTGDLGRWLPDGTIEFLGRKDHQVKIRGYRIELGEIERHLAELPGVREAVVTDREDKNAEKYLCAYIVMSQPAKSAFNAAELREYLKSRLPDAMIPAYFVPLEAIPLTLNGKVNRNALPEPETVLPGEEYAPPGNQTEQVLTEIWAETLKMEKDSISIDANFFQLGGHSLTATILIAQIHKRLDVKVNLTELFKTPTIRGLASYIIGARKEPYQTIEIVGKKDYYALSSGQRQFYFIQQMEPESTTLNSVSIIPLDGQLNLARLEETFKQMINRHESLRTSFVMTREGPVQKIHEEVEFALQYYNWTTRQWAVRKMKNENENNRLNGPGSDVDDRLIEKIIGDFQQPFDLSKAPLLRVGTVKVDQNKQFFLWDVNHIVADGISQDIFVKDFLALYRGEKLPALKLTYKDYSEWQNSEKTKKLLKNQETYWLKQFEGEIPIQELPTDYERPETRSFAGERWEFRLDSEKTTLLKKMALELDVTLFMVLLATYNVLLYKLSGQEDVIVGTVLAGRKHPDLKNIIGMFLNVLALRNSPRGNKTFKEFLETVGERTLAAFENQGYLFDHLVDKVLKNRDIRRYPLFNASIILQNFQDELPGMKAAEKYNTSRFEIVTTTTDDLRLFISEEADGSLFFFFDYSSLLFKQSTIQRFSRIFKQILTQTAENPDVLLAEIKTENPPPKKAKRTSAILETQLEPLLREGKLMSSGELETAFTQISWHYRINQRYLYSQGKKTDWGIMAYSNINAEPLWNHAVFTSTLTGRSPGEISRYLQEIVVFFTDHRRYPALCVIPESPGFNFLNDILRKKKYRVHYVDTWQVYDWDKCEHHDLDQPGSQLTIKPVETDREIDVFIDLLSQTFLLYQVYMGNFLKSNFCAERGKYLKSYIGYDNGTPVCVASLLKEDKYAYTINLGILEQCRGKGYGKRMMLHLQVEAKRLGTEVMFLHTPFGSNSEQMYEELGIVPEFHRFFYVLDDITFPVTQGEVFWKNHLKGFKTPTVLPMKPISPSRNRLPGDRIWASEKIELSERLKKQLAGFAAKEHLDTNTLVIGAWVLLLSYYCHAESVLFGTGLAKNAYLPMGVLMKPQEDILSWLGYIRDITDNIRCYRNFPLIDIHEWSDIPKGQPLFQHVLEFLEPMDSQTWNPRQHLYPLICKIISPIQRIEIQYDTDYYDNGFVSGLIDHWLRLMEGIKNTILQDRNSQAKDISIAHDFMEAKSGMITGEPGDFHF